MKTFEREEFRSSNLIVALIIFNFVFKMKELKKALDEKKLLALNLITTKDEKIVEEILTYLFKNNITTEYIQMFKKYDKIYIYLEVKDEKDVKKKLENLKIKLGNRIVEIEIHKPFMQIYGKRVIVIGGGAQVSQVVLGAVTEADRHNLRGERISVDTIPLVGEEDIAEAVKAVGRLHRAAILILAGSLMGGKITQAVKELKEKHGIPVISLNMAGSVPEVADLVVTDPVQAGVMAVMTIASTAKFDLNRVKGKKF